MRDPCDHLYAYNTAGGCQVNYPNTEPQNQPKVSPGNCDNVTKDPEGHSYTWKQEDIYELSYHDYTIGGWPDIYPIPQIYAEPIDQHHNGANSEQWYRIGLYYQLKHGDYIAFL